MGKTILLLVALLIASSTLLPAAEHPAAPPIPDQTIIVSAETLAGLPRVKAEAKEHENPAATYEGVTLGSILERTGVPRGKRLRGSGLRTIVIVTATDGYEVVFTVAETDPAFSQTVSSSSPTRRTVSRYPRRKALFRIIVPAEKRPARWIRNVKTIAITSVD